MSEVTGTQSQTAGQAASPLEWTDPLACYGLTSALALLGVLVGFSLLPPGRTIPYGESSFLLRCAAWDGGQYLSIVEHGYQYDPKMPSNVAFFPALPLLAWGVASATQWSAATSLLLITHIALALTFVLLFQYARDRFADRPSMAAWTVLAFGLFPVSFFFRMAYSESLFLLFCVLTLYGLRRRWPLPLVAIVVGAATSTRFLGIALVVPLMLQIPQRERLIIDRLALIAFTLPLSVWGVLAFMFFLWLRFDDPLVFARSVDTYFLRPPVALPDRLWALVTGEPIWGNYAPSSNAYWRHFAPEPAAWLNLQFANPLYFLLAVLMLGVGAGKRILNRDEVVLSALLLLIPYLSRGYDFCMGSQARYAAAAFPLYLVWGAFLSRLPMLISVSLLAFGGFLLAIYAALFAAWYFVV